MATELQTFIKECSSEVLEQAMEEISREFEVQQHKEGVIPKTEEEKEAYFKSEKEQLMRILGRDDGVVVAQKGLNLVLKEGAKLGVTPAAIERLDKAGKTLFGKDVVKLLGKETLKTQVGLKEKLGLSSDDLLEVHKAGMACYDEKRLRDAISIFSWIVLVDYFCFSPWMMIGISFFELELYPSSLEALRVATLLKIEDPYPHLYTVYVFLQMNDRESAQVYLDWALTEINADEIKKNESIIQSIKEQINKKVNV